MEKDMAYLREQQAQKARLRIAGEGAPPLQQESVPAVRRTLAGTRLPRPISRTQKILVRMVIGAVVFALLAFGGGFLYWKIFRQNSTEVPSAETGKQVPEEPVTPTPPPPSSASGFQGMQSLLASFAASRADGEDIRTVPVLHASGADPDSLPLEAGLPPRIAELFEPPLALALVPEGTGRQAALIIPLRKEHAAEQALQDWEQDMEEDIRPLFGPLLERGEGYVPFFRTTSHQGARVRYKTVASSAPARELSYGVFEDTIVIATSLSALRETADREIMETL